jgi:hypothetical protein
MDRLHPATRAIADATDPDVAFALAIRLITEPPSDWDPREWSSIGAAANASASADPRWFKVKALACEHDNSSTGATDALWARAHLILALGADNADDFRSMSAFVARAQALVNSDTPDAALEAYKAAHTTIFTVEQGTSAWLAARDAFLRCRRLREFAEIVAAMTDAGHALPTQLKQWRTWALLREEDFPVANR